MSLANVANESNEDNVANNLSRHQYGVMMERQGKNITLICEQNIDMALNMSNKSVVVEKDSSLHSHKSKNALDKQYGDGTNYGSFKLPERGNLKSTSYHPHSNKHPDHDVSSDEVERDARGKYGRRKGDGERQQKGKESGQEDRSRSQVESFLPPSKRSKGDSRPEHGESSR